MLSKHSYSQRSTSTSYLSVQTDKPHSAPAHASFHKREFCGCFPQNKPLLVVPCHLGERGSTGHSCAGETKLGPPCHTIATYYVFQE